MSKISAFKRYNNDSFSSFIWYKDPIISSSPYYYDKEKGLKESEILPSNISTKTGIAARKIANTLTVYPVKGFTGDKNSNFYEYLTMGAFPYITGGLTFIALFNAISKHLNLKNAQAAKQYGLGMALGVVFYAAAKAISQKFVSVPVKMKTGVDLDLPCKNVVSLISSTPEEYEAEEERLKALKEAGIPDKKSFEYHKVFESVDYPRFDLLYKKDKGSKRNEYYDKIAEKNGFGTDLKDSDQEVKPFIKEVVAKAKTAQNLSKYLWAAVGVGIGIQNPWGKLIDLKGNLSGLPLGTKIKRAGKAVYKAAKESCKEFFNGGSAGAINTHAKIAGRTILGLALLTTVAGAINAMRNPYIKNTKNMEKSSVFNNSKKVVED